MSGIASGTALSLAGIGTGVLGSAASGFGKYTSGQEQKKADDYNAAIAIQNAQLSEQTSEDEFTVLSGKQAASYARSGVDLSSGSPLLVMMHTAAQGGKQQESQAVAGDEQSQLDKYYGKVAAFSGTVGGIDDFLGGLSKGIIQSGPVLNP
jgi:hypothetical protein